MLRFLLILFGLSLFLLQDVFAQQHRVRSGETLFSISRQYNVTVDQIRNWNNITGNEIEIDQLLIVTHTEIAQEPIKESDIKSHRVLRGETLFSISRRYGITVQDIMEWNNLSSTSISVGQYLYVEPIPETPVASDPVIIAEVPADDVAISTDNDVEADIDFSVPEPSHAHYTVEPGDTMYRIARAHNMTVSELQELNNMSGTNLEIGDRLLIRAFRTPPSVLTQTETSTPQGAFITHTVTESDDLLDVLNHYRMDRYEFAALNPFKNIQHVQQGESVILLAPTTSISANPYRVQSRIKGIEEIRVDTYTEQEISRTLTSGELYNPAHLTAAHPSLSLGSVVYVENPNNGVGLFILINDRITDNVLKLSRAAFTSLGYHNEEDVTVAILYEDLN